MHVPSQSHEPFALVLAGGGARGLAHAGVLRALEHDGYRPSALVGVSMGAVVAVTYGLNPRWYEGLLGMDTRGFPRPYSASDHAFRERLRAAVALGSTVRDMILGWGVGGRALPRGRRLLYDLTLGGALEECRLPVAVAATDLLSGRQTILTQGDAARAAYASSALAGILPPLPWGDMLLADGAYSDIAPTKVARELVPQRVVAVDVGLPLDAPPRLRNGVQTLARALEICHARHAHLLFEQADLVLRPEFPVPIHALDFSRKRTAVAAGVRAVRSQRTALARLLAGETGVGPVESRLPPRDQLPKRRPPRPSDPAGGAELGARRYEVS